MLYVKSDGGYKPAESEEILQVAMKEAKKGIRKGINITSPKIAEPLLVGLLSGRKHEVFCVAFLDSGLRLIAFEEMFQGTISMTAVSIRPIAVRAVELGASSLLFIHNHPAGDCDPSKMDLEMTLKMKLGLALLEIDLLDHYVVAKNGLVSMRNKHAEMAKKDPPMDQLTELLKEVTGGQLGNVEKVKLN